ncbi:MAG: hypothetical protein R3F17_16290 [Planctomycetota bacterium]
MRCTYDPDTFAGKDPAEGGKVKGIIHWVSAADAVTADVHVIDTLFTQSNPMDLEEGQDYMDLVNPAARVVLHGCRLEPDLATVAAGQPLQFERLGYFLRDEALSAPGAPVFLRSVSLRDSRPKEE